MNIREIETAEALQLRHRFYAPQIKFSVAALPFHHVVAVCCPKRSEPVK